MAIKAIETTYRGYKFRSRLEARWAIFFDRLGIQWEYEAEGYRLSNGEMYLPDFEVVTPDGARIFYEIKPAHIDVDPKFAQLKHDLREFDLQNPDAFGPSAILLSGDPAKAAQPQFVCPRCGVITEPSYGLCVHEDGGFEFGCEFCDSNTPYGSGHPYEDGLTMAMYPHKGMLCTDIPGSWTMHSSKILGAAMAARGARFEHGAMHPLV